MPGISTFASRGSPTLPPFYTADYVSMIGGPANDNYLEPLASPSEILVAPAFIFTEVVLVAATT